MVVGKQRGNNYTVKKGGGGLLYVWGRRGVFSICVTGASRPQRPASLQIRGSSLPDIPRAACSRRWMRGECTPLSLSPACLYSKGPVSDPFLITCRRAVPLLGYLPQDLIGMPVLCFIHPDDRPLMLAIHKKGKYVPYPPVPRCPFER